MKVSVLTILIILSAFFISTKNKVDTFSQLYALEGAWKMQVKKGFIYEEWKLVNKNQLKGRGCFIKGNDTTMSEQMVLDNKPDGIFYTSTVADQNNHQPIPFALTSSENKIFIFENLQHDFPKQIVYELIGRDSLHAYIDDTASVIKKRQDFYYQRVN